MKSYDIKTYSFSLKEREEFQGLSWSPLAMATTSYVKFKVYDVSIYLY